MKQSSIEFLLDKFGDVIGDINTTNEQDLMLMEIIKQAKAMHKDEIENAYDDGWHHNNKDFYNPVGYYNETFNTKEK